MNRRGTIYDIIPFMVITLLVIFTFAGFIYMIGQLTTNLVAISTPAGAGFNISDAAQDTFGLINTGLSPLRWLALVIVFSMVISILVSNFLVRANPVFFILYVMISVAAVIFSAYISNAYETILLAGTPLTSTLQSFTGIDYILLHLPIVTIIVGALGAIALFIGAIVPQGESL